MKLYVIVIMTLVKLAASTWEEELEYKSKTMSPSDFVEHFNDNNQLWKIKQYDFNINLDVNNRYNEANHDLPVKRVDFKALRTRLPRNFDARVKWPQCAGIMSQIRDQHHCGSCWAHGVANTASDRLCIHRNLTVDLSEQDLECAHPLQSICHGGNAMVGFMFWRNHGLVSKTCKPYEPLNLNRNKCERFCKFNPVMGDYVKNKIYANEIYTVPRDSQSIKAEIFHNGPVQAMMYMYSDFQNENGNGYHSGIYVHTHGQLVTNHSVRVIGYGVEKGVEYWLAANSWGETWGENGFFRIKAYQEDIGFEDMMLTGY